MGHIKIRLLSVTNNNNLDVHFCVEHHSIAGPDVSHCENTIEFKNHNSPALLTLKLVHRPQDVTEGTSRLEVQETLSLKTG